MERKIGEIFKQKNTNLKCVEGDTCHGCFYNRKSNHSKDFYCIDFSFHAGICDGSLRSDNKSVIFIVKCD